MTRFLNTWLLMALALGALAPVALADSAKGTVVRLHMASPALHDGSRSVRVYLPAGYDQARDRRYPVVYMLHGWPGGNGNWPGSGRADVTLDSLIASDAIPPVIAVWPDGNGIGLIGRSVYVNSWDGRSRMEDFIVRELQAYIDSVYRTRREARMRGIMGLSDGGFAAFNLAFKHPDVFGAAASHSGYFRLKRDVSIQRVLGDDPGAARMAAENSPLDFLPRVAPGLTGMPLYFDCGTSDEDLASNRELDHALTKLGVPHTYHEFSGNHGWGYWKSHLHQSLRALTERMR